MLVCTFIPSLTAVASTYGLNDEPTGAGASEKLNAHLTRSHCLTCLEVEVL